MGEWGPVLIVATILWVGAIVWMVVSAKRKNESFWKNWSGDDTRPVQSLLGFVWLWVCCFFVALVVLYAGSGVGLDPEDMYRRP